MLLVLVFDYANIYIYLILGQLKGVDGITGEIKSVDSLGGEFDVWEPYLVKVQIYKTAIEVNLNNTFI